MYTSTGGVSGKSIVLYINIANNSIKPPQNKTPPTDRFCLYPFPSLLSHCPRPSYQVPTICPWTGQDKHLQTSSEFISGPAFRIKRQTECRCRSCKLIFAFLELCNRQ